jgi:hypothetical protein
MKIWADNVKEGDSFWYKSGIGFKFSKVVKKDFKTFMMPSLLMENGDRLFVNEYVYLFGLPLNLSKYIVYCPENTIANDFRIDLE